MNFELQGNRIWIENNGQRQELELESILKNQLIKEKLDSTLAENQKQQKRLKDKLDELDVENKEGKPYNIFEYEHLEDKLNEYAGEENLLKSILEGEKNA